MTAKNEAIARLIEEHGQERYDEQWKPDGTLDLDKLLWDEGDYCPVLHGRHCRELGNTIVHPPGDDCGWLQVGCDDQLCGTWIGDIDFGDWQKANNTLAAFVRWDEGSSCLLPCEQDEALVYLASNRVGHLGNNWAETQIGKHMDDLDEPPDLEEWNSDLRPDWDKIYFTVDASGKILDYDYTFDEDEQARVAWDDDADKLVIDSESRFLINPPTGLDEILTSHLVICNRFEVANIACQAERFVFSVGDIEVLCAIRQQHETDEADAESCCCGVSAAGNVTWYCDANNDDNQWDEWDEPESTLLEKWWDDYGQDL